MKVRSLQSWDMCEAEGCNVSSGYGKGVGGSVPLGAVHREAEVIWCFVE